MANAATLSSASLALSDPRPYTASPLVGNAVTYTFTGSNVTRDGAGAGNIQCIKQVYADTATGSTVPSGMVTTSATLDTTNTNYIPSPGTWTLDASVNGTLKLTKASAAEPASSSARKVVYDSVRNPTTVATAYFMRFTTYTDQSCTTPLDTTTVEFILSGGSAMSLTIDNTLSFSVAGHTASSCMTGVTATVDNSASPNTIPYGTVSTNAIACQVLTAATNATGGYTIFIRDTGQLANTLGQQIPDVASTSGSYTNGNTNASPGSFTNNTSSLATYPGFNQGAYGYTTDDATLGTGTAARFTSGGQKWAAYGHGASTTNAEVGYESVGVTSTTYTIAHQVGITTLTQPGVYSTTVIYTCTPVY